MQWTGGVAGPTPGCHPGGTLSTTHYENYVYVGGRRLAMLKSRYLTCENGTDVFVVDGVYHYVSDKLDLPRAVYRMSDGKKVWSADFDAFGNPLGFINEDPDDDCVYFSQPFRLPGQYALTPQEGGPTSTSGGLHENWHRLYDSKVGRYLQPDRHGVPGSRGIGALLNGSRLPPSNNLYSYSASSPFAFFDPDGRSPTAELAKETAPRAASASVPRLAPLLCRVAGPLGIVASVLMPSSTVADDDGPTVCDRCGQRDPDDPCNRQYEIDVALCSENFYSAMMIDLCIGCAYEEWWRCKLGPGGYGPGVEEGPWPGSKCAELQQKITSGLR